MSLLDPAEIESRLLELNGWIYEARALRKTFTFDDYQSGIAFVNRLADTAENQGHHPDLDVGYGRVVVRISTHSEEGVTDKDFRLASAVDQL
jgi:4a-hydroxytetrahydrobiopterin dehydratase